MSSHLIDGEFQSDKYPTTPRGKVPLSVKDPTAQDLLWEYAQRRRTVDAEFSDDLEAALRGAGFVPDELGIKLSSGKYHAVVSDRPPCARCGGLCVVAFEINASGYSMGGGYKHAAECPVLRCSHGLKWEETCSECDAAEELNCHGDVG